MTDHEQRELMREWGKAHVHDMLSGMDGVTTTDYQAFIDEQEVQTSD